MCTKACTSTRTTITSSCSASKTRTNCWAHRCSTCSTNRSPMSSGQRSRSFRDDSSDELSFAFRGRTTSGTPIAGQMTLSGAEYEGEHCTQVLVRSETVPVFQDAVPVLQDALPPLDEPEPTPLRRRRSQTATARRPVPDDSCVPCGARHQRAADRRHAGGRDRRLRRDAGGTRPTAFRSAGFATRRSADG